MADVRRAYGRWLRRRLLWLVPSFLLSCAISLNLASDPHLPAWIRVPSFALSIGVAVLFVVLVVQTILVVWERARGGSRQAQRIRTELRPYPAIGLTSLLVLLALLAVPWMFPELPPVTVPLIHRPAGHAIEARSPAEPPPAAEAVSPAVVPGESDKAVTASAPPEVRPPEPVGAPQILPEIARLPDLPFLWEEWEPPVRTPAQEEGAAGTDRFGMKHRPGSDDDAYLQPATSTKSFNRAGLPSELDLESWIPPELQVEVMIISRSGPWRGSAFETGFDLPFGRNDSIRFTYGIMMLTDDQSFDGLEPSFAWHRGTVEYVRRLAGYTRQSMFDLAFRIGLTADKLSTHEAGVHFDSAVRLSPWFGLESAVWEDEGVGLVVQAGHSPATRLTKGSSRVTDVRVFVRIDLGERSSVELGWRITSVRFRDRTDAEDEYADKMNRSFSGPIAGLTVRF